MQTFLINFSLNIKWHRLSSFIKSMLFVSAFISKLLNYLCYCKLVKYSSIFKVFSYLFVVRGMLCEYMVGVRLSCAFAMNYLCSPTCVYYEYNDWNQKYIQAYTTRLFCPGWKSNPPTSVHRVVSLNLYCIFALARLFKLTVLFVPLNGY